MSHIPIPSRRRYVGCAFAWAAIACTLFSIQVSAGSPELPLVGSDNVFNITAGSSILTGNQTVQHGYYHGGLYIETEPSIGRSSDLFDRPFSLAFAYGRHPSERHLILTAELAFTVIDSRKVLLGEQWESVTPRTADRSAFIYLGSLKIEAVRPLADYYNSRLLPQVGVFLKFGSGNLNRISWQSVIFASGPVVALDLKFSRSADRMTFMALHTSLAYAQSFTDGWPSQLELASGLRFSWR